MAGSHGHLHGLATASHETSGLIFLFTTLSTSSVPLVLFADGAGLAEQLARAEQPFW